MSLLTCADRVVPDAADRVRRYCGLRWTGGGPEVWAYRYFDAVGSRGSSSVDPVDVVCCAALHPTLTRADLDFFVRRRAELEAWLADAPVSVGLADAQPELVDHVERLAELADGVGLSLLSKVMHHKRPGLVPMLDRDIIDWYRPVTGLRGAASWRALIIAIRADLAFEPNRRILAEITTDIAEEMAGPAPTPLRMLDIAIWMGRVP